MHDDNEDQGLDLDTGRHVEDARDHNPDASEDEGIVDKVKDALGVDDDDSDDVGDDEDNGLLDDTDDEDDETLV